MFAAHVHIRVELLEDQYVRINHRSKVRLIHCKKTRLQQDLELGFSEMLLGVVARGGRLVPATGAAAWAGAVGGRRASRTLSIDGVGRRRSVN